MEILAAKWNWTVLKEEEGEKKRGCYVLFRDGAEGGLKKAETSLKQFLYFLLRFFPLCCFGPAQKQPVVKLPFVPSPSMN